MKDIKDGFTGLPECIPQQPFESIEVSYANDDSKIRVVRETYFISETEGYLLRHVVYDENDLVIKSVNTQITIDEAEMITKIHMQYRASSSFLNNRVSSYE